MAFQLPELLESRELTLCVQADRQGGSDSDSRAVDSVGRCAHHNEIQAGAI
jgi:hypothetical protein